MVKSTLEYVEDYPIDRIIPYERNARDNDAAVPAIIASMDGCGNNDPIEVNEDGVILAGHTRLKALKQLGKKTARVIVVKGLNEEQQKAYRLAHNKTNEIASWLDDLVLEELSEIETIDMKPLGFDRDVVDWNNLEDRFHGETNEEYEAFTDKFELKHTTDDCFTPPAVYDVVVEWARTRYGISEDTKIIRPFYPGGDYQAFNYPKDCVVIDNPPFSILRPICDFYISKGIPFFLFCNHLTAGNLLVNEKVNLVLAESQIVYENGAVVQTSFMTNMGDAKIIVSGELHDMIEEAQPSDAKEVNQYEYPDNLITSARVGRLAKYGANFEIKTAAYTDEVDGTHIFGGGDSDF